MPTSPTLLSLPTALLTLLATVAGQAENHAQWPPNHHLHTLHGGPEKQPTNTPTLAGTKPAKVRKMSEDEGEKFYLGYWSYGAMGQDDRGGAASGNATGLQQLHAPYAPHGYRERRDILGLRALGGRVFGRQTPGWGACPGNTHDCGGIGEVNYCCGDGEGCFETDEGGVGCCPDGVTCGTAVAGCDAAAGYESCPGDEGGGCCIPGFTCAGVGCVAAGTSTVFTTLPVETVTTGRPPSTTTVVISSTSTDTLPTTIVVPANTLTEPSPGDTDTTTTTILVPPPSTSSEESYTSTTTVTPNAPVRPTSASSATSPPPRTTQNPDNPPPATCPGGYYQCSAVYLGDCCRVGRDCDTTSCPPSAATTVITSSATIAVPATTTAGENQGGCASEWFLCPEEEGGGCCPRGYACGEDSCSATDAEVEDVGKEAPSQAGLRVVVGWVWGFWVLGVATGVGMVVL
ncbi:hypothetical protein MBLNU230_g6346t1 [Neophaeotheca triangularis]